MIVDASIWFMKELLRIPRVDIYNLIKWMEKNAIFQRKVCTKYRNNLILTIIWMDTKLAVAVF